MLIKDDQLFKDNVMVPNSLEALSIIHRSTLYKPETTHNVYARH